MILPVSKIATAVVLRCVNDQIDSRLKLDSNHEQKLLNENPSLVLCNPQKEKLEISKTTTFSTTITQIHLIQMHIFHQG